MTQKHTHTQTKTMFVLCCHRSPSARRKQNVGTEVLTIAFQSGKIVAVRRGVGGVFHLYLGTAEL